MTFDMDKMVESKRAMRKRLAALPIAEKLKLLDVMRKREVAIRQAKFTASKCDDAQSIDLTSHGEHK